MENRNIENSGMNTPPSVPPAKDGTVANGNVRREAMGAAEQPRRAPASTSDKTDGVGRMPEELDAERTRISSVKDVRQDGTAGAKSAEAQDATKVIPNVNDATKTIDMASVTGNNSTGVEKVGKNNAKSNGKNAKPRKIKKKDDEGEAGNTVISLVKCMAYITGVFVIATILSVAIIFCANDIYGFVKSEEPVEITIPEDATVKDVAKILHDNKVIKYEWLFKMKEGSFSGKFAPGTYSVSPESSYDDLIYTLREKPPTGISWVTIPEGFTTDEIINLLVEKGIGKKEKYVDVINNYDFDFWFVDELGEDWDRDGRIYRLDGYLFPDTYQFYNASTEEAVIKKLLTRFNQVFTDSYKQRAEELGFTVDQILNIAALIEKEAGTAADFGNVSSVFHNRLKNPADFPRLESDATIAYAVQHETGVRPNLTGEDIENNDSPYNSYKVNGLVPGPIANPSNSAILAALNPSETNYYYFVSSDSETYFSSNIYDHQAAINKILAEREQNAGG
ncbi:MAG: endolytic transglycosylase MltG [Clostridia bacterium]|nr:endolytic transglycosylase MltG [Clostridia bacterium]